MFDLESFCHTVLFLFLPSFCVLCHFSLFFFKCQSLCSMGLLSRTLLVVLDSSLLS